MPLGLGLPFAQKQVKESPKQSTYDQNQQTKTFSWTADSGSQKRTNKQQDSPIYSSSQVEAATNRIYKTMKQSLDEFAKLGRGAAKTIELLEADLARCKRDKALREKELTTKLAQLEDDYKNLNIGRSGSFPSDGATPSLLSDHMYKVTDACNKFVNKLNRALQESGVQTKNLADVFRPLYLHPPEGLPQVFGRDLLLSFVFSMLFLDFENESFESGGTVIALGKAERIRTALGHFRDLTKASSQNDRQLTELLSGFMDSKMAIMIQTLKDYEAKATAECGCPAPISSIFPINDSKDGFQELLRLLQATFVLHRVAFAMDPPASIVRVASGHRVTAAYMEASDEVPSFNPQGRAEASVVNFMVRPAFCVRDKVCFRGLYYALVPEAHVGSLPKQVPDHNQLQSESSRHSLQNKNALAMGQDGVLKQPVAPGISTV